MFRTPPFADYRPIVRASLWLLLVGLLFLVALIPALGMNFADILVPKGFSLALMLVSPVLTAPALVCAVPTAIVLARRGWAGWLPALAAGVGFGILFSKSFEAVVPGWIFAGFSCAYGLTFWLILRWKCPEVLGVAPSPAESPIG